MARYTIYHNPRCSKSREALSLLQAQNASIDVIEYLKQTPSLLELRTLLKQLGGDARQMLRSKEEEYQTLQLDNPTLTDNSLLAAIVSHPILLERPIVSDGKRAIIARPPEVLSSWLK